MLVQREVFKNSKYGVGHINEVVMDINITGFQADEVPTGFPSSSSEKSIGTAREFPYKSLSTSLFCSAREGRTPEVSINSNQLFFPLFFIRVNVS